MKITDLEVFQVGSPFTLIDESPFLQRLPYSENLPGIESVQAVGEAASNSIMVSFSAVTAVSVIAGGSMEMMWSFINALQLVHFIPMMTLTFPPNGRLMFSYVSLANMDNVFMQGIFEAIFDTAELDDQQFNERFARQGFESK